MTNLNNCQRGDDSCQWPWFAERLADTEFISYPFENWANIILTVFIVLVIYGSGTYFSLPFLQYNKNIKEIRKKEKLEAKERKKKRAEERKERRKRRLKDVMKKANSIQKVLAKEKSSIADLATAAKASDARKKSVEARAAEQKPNTGAGVELVSLNFSPEGEKQHSPLLDDATPPWLGINYELVDADNKAFAISYSGFVLALCIVLSGPRLQSDPSEDPVISCYETLVWSVIGIFLLSLNYFVQNKILLRGINNQKELLKGNLCVGVTEAGAFVATALNVRAVVSGPGGGFLDNIISTAIFFACGQVCMVAFAVLFQIITPYDDLKLAKQGNVASGIRFASNLVALSLLTSTPLKKSDEVATFFVFFLVSSMFLVGFGQLLDRLVLPGKMNKEVEEDDNWGLALISGAMLIVTAFLLDTLLPEIPCPGSDAYDAYIQFYSTL